MRLNGIKWGKIWPNWTMSKHLPKRVKQGQIILNLVKWGLSVVNRSRARKMFFMFFKEWDLFFCSLKNAFLGQMFFIFRKYYILIHKAMVSWPIMLTFSPPQSHPVPDFTIVTLKWHNTTLNCHCHLSSLLTGNK